MAILEAVITEIVKKVLERISARTNVQEGARWSVGRLRDHLTEVANWSGRIDFYGLGQAHETDSDTVGLFTSLPRKFRVPSRAMPRNTESDLLSASGNLVLLGDPGAGKTTTLKRLARILLLQPPVSDSDSTQYPIVVRLRELNRSTLLESALATAAGFGRSKAQGQGEAGRIEELERTHFTGARRINAVMKVLNQSRALILLDGLDEVSPMLRSRTEETIEALSRKCDGARLIVSCRSGDYVRVINGFDPVEICPLEHRQISNIAKRWCARPREFLGALRNLPFADLATRPLFLCELVVLYDKAGFLPSQPAAVYRRIVLLALEEWDRQKPVTRKSHYSDFNPDRKLEFLASLAFQLTYIQGTNFFTTSSLLRAYEAIRESFGLPKDEAKQVVREMETHTGILIEGGYDRWEFSHLSIQEFLAAHYLVRDQVTRESVRQLLKNPAPVAISIAIAANPTRRLAALFSFIRIDRKDQTTFILSLFSRLLQERPIFARDPLLGIVGMELVLGMSGPFGGEDSLDTDYRDAVPLDARPQQTQIADLFAPIEEFLQLEVVRQSMQAALRAYTATKVFGLNQNAYILRLRESWQNQLYEMNPPAVMTVAASLFHDLLKSLDLGLQLNPNPLELEFAEDAYNVVSVEFADSPD